MRRHRTRDQDQIFIEFMESHPMYATNVVKGDKMRESMAWMELAKKLNAAGPPFKNFREWKKVWSDWKAGVKKKLMANQQNTLSRLDNAVARLTNLYEFNGTHRNFMQGSILVEFMQQHPHVARNSQSSVQHAWTQLAKHLNDVGPPFKEVGEWKQVWRDWTKSVKKKITDDCEALTPAEKTIARVTDLYETLDEESPSEHSSFEIAECSKKVKQEHHDEDDSSGDPIGFEITSVNSYAVPAKRSRRQPAEFDQLDLLDDSITVKVERNDDDDDYSKYSYSIEAESSSPESFAKASKKSKSELNKTEHAQQNQLETEVSPEETYDLKTVTLELQSLKNQIKVKERDEQARSDAFLAMGNQICQLLQSQVKEQKRTNDVLEKLANKMSN